MYVHFSTAVYVDIPSLCLSPAQLRTHARTHARPCARMAASTSVD